MFSKTRFARDTFAFSLGGMGTIAPVVLPPAIADDLINKVRDERLKHGRISRRGNTGSAPDGDEEFALGACA